jgi:hypothetical protein
MAPSRSKHRMHGLVAQPLSARGEIMSGVDTGMLSCGVDVPQPPLQRRCLIDGAGASEPVAGRDRLAAHLGDPGGGLMAAGGSIQILYAAGERVLPVDIALFLHERARCSHKDFRAAELVLNGRRVFESDSAVHRAPAGIGQVNQVLNGSLRQTQCERGVGADKKPGAP